MAKQMNHRGAIMASWRLPFIQALSSRRVSILLYHGIPDQREGTYIDSTVFENQIGLLKKHFEFIAPNRLTDNRSALDNICVLLTFDDGFRNHAEVVAPILRKHNVPAIFFVCTRHATPGKYLWFSYLRALERHFPGDSFVYRGELMNMSFDQRRTTVRRLSELLLSLTPHPSAMYEAIDEELPRLEDFVTQNELRNQYAGMTAEQVGELAADPLFSIGAHTTDHPFLTKCETGELVKQIYDNKSWIENISGHCCNALAYPSGDYNAACLEECRKLGIVYGHALTPMLGIDSSLELPRMGVYSNSLEILGAKVLWGNFINSARAFRIKLGASVPGLFPGDSKKSATASVPYSVNHD